MIQSWTVDAEPLERALRDEGIDASFARADFEAALNAALAHEHFDVAIFDPSTPGLTRELVEHCFRISGRDTPLVVLDSADTVGAEVCRIVAPRRN